MSLEMLGLIQLGTLLVAIFLGFPIAFTLIILAIVFGYIGFGTMVFDLMVIQAFGFMQEEVLAAVPLFVFMGYILERAGVIERLFGAFQKIMGGVKGSLYIVVLLTATIFATATGIIGACITVIGLLAVPPMMKSEYDQRLSAGVITAGGMSGDPHPSECHVGSLGAGGRCFRNEAICRGSFTGPSPVVHVHGLCDVQELQESKAGTAASP